MFFFQLQQKKIFLADADSAATQKPRLRRKYGIDDFFIRKR